MAESFLAEAMGPQYLGLKKFFRHNQGWRSASEDVPDLFRAVHGQDEMIFQVTRAERQS